jgi:branched-subunit amino acid transport protein
MSDLEIWIVIVSLAVATAITRSGFWLVGHKVTIPPRVQEMLRYAPSCALAAIIGPDLLLDGAAMNLDPFNAKLIAGAASVAWFAWRRRMLETIVFGMLFFTVLRLLPGLLQLH